MYHLQIFGIGYFMKAGKLEGMAECVVSIGGILLSTSICWPSAIRSEGERERSGG